MVAHISLYTLINMVVWYLALRYVYEKLTTKKTDQHYHDVNRSTVTKYKAERKTYY